MTSSNWRPGYEPMLNALRNGHRPTKANQKGEQTDPGKTGCDFADGELLPVLREKELCLDQEWFL